MNRSEYKDCGLLSIKQTDGLGLCPEDLQTPRKKCRPPGKRLWVKNAHSKP